MSKSRSKNNKKFKEKCRLNNGKQIDILDTSKVKLDFELLKGEKFKRYLDTDYYASNQGRILIRDKEDNCTLVTLITDDKGGRIATYQRAHMNGRFEYVHRIIAEVWCKGRTDICNQVHHIDGNGCNNHYKI